MAAAGLSSPSSKAGRESFASCGGETSIYNRGNHFMEHLALMEEEHRRPKAAFATSSTTSKIFGQPTLGNEGLSGEQGRESDAMSAPPMCFSGSPRLPHFPLAESASEDATTNSNKGIISASSNKREHSSSNLELCESSKQDARDVVRFALAGHPIHLLSPRSHQHNHLESDSHTAEPQDTALHQGDFASLDQTHSNSHFYPHHELQGHMATTSNSGGEPIDSALASDPSPSHSDYLHTGDLHGMQNHHDYAHQHHQHHGQSNGVSQHQHQHEEQPHPHHPSSSSHFLEQSGAHDAGELGGGGGGGEDQWLDLSHTFQAAEPVDVPDIFPQPISPPPSLPCTHPGCSRVFKTSGSLAVHMRTHTGEKPFLCEECGKSFSDGSTLRQHRVVHSRERMYRCRFCDKVFGRSSIARAHERTTHEMTTTVDCKECGRVFSSMSSLTRHMQTHSGEKPHVCRICAKSFGRLHHLERHMKTHKQADDNGAVSVSISVPILDEGLGGPTALNFGSVTGTPLSLAASLTTTTTTTTTTAVPRTQNPRAPLPPRTSARMPALAPPPLPPTTQAPDHGPFAAAAAASINGSALPLAPLALPLPLSPMLDGSSLHAAAVSLPRFHLAQDSSSANNQLSAHTSASLSSLVPPSFMSSDHAQMHDGLGGPDAFGFSLPPFSSHSSGAHDANHFCPDMSFMDHTDFGTAAPSHPIAEPFAGAPFDAAHAAAAGDADHGHHHHHHHRHRHHDEEDQNDHHHDLNLLFDLGGAPPQP